MPRTTTPAPPEDRRVQITREPEEELTTINVYVPQSTKAWLAKEAFERNAAGGDRVTISSIVRDAIDAARAG